MPRKDVPACETEKSVFAQRLTKAMKERGENQTTLAEKITAQYLTIQRQTISLYMNGQSKPDTERLTAIAKVLNVSSDWLLGLSHEKSTDVDVRAICNKTGLCEKAVEMIIEAKNSEINSDGEFFDFINDLLVGPGSMFSLIIRNLYDYRNACEARYLRIKLYMKLADEEFQQITGKNVPEDEATYEAMYTEAIEKASKKYQDALDKLAGSQQYKKRVRELIATQNFIESENEAADSINKIFSDRERFDISEIYKSRVIQWFMITLAEYEDKYDADKDKRQ